MFFDDKYSITDYLTMDVLPGYRLNPDILLYGRAGVAFRNAFFTQEAVIGEFESVTDSTNSVNGRFAVGVTYSLSKKLGCLT